MEIENKFASQVNKRKEIDERYRLWTMGQLVDEKRRTTKLDAQHPLYTGFDTFDEITKNKMRGRLIFHVGYGGTKKSLGCTQTLLKSYEKTSCNSLYSNMEMSNDGQFDRILDLTMSTYGYKYSERFEAEILDPEKEEEAVREMKEAMDLKFGNKLMINGTCGMDIDDYKRLLDIYEDTYNEPIHNLIIDGMSMTGGVGTETEKMNENSKALKQLADDRYMAINAIVHCAKTSGSRAGTYHTRDLKPFMRGSEKLFDNCDRVYYYSLCQDPINEGMYLKDKGWIRLVDKRGTGEVKDLIYNFDPISLRMTESNEDPQYYEIKETANW